MRTLFSLVLAAAITLPTLLSPSTPVSPPTASQLDPLTENTQDASYLKQSVLPILHLELIPGTAVPGSAVAIHWWIENYENLTNQEGLELRIVPPDHATLTDGGETGLDPLTFSGQLQAGLQEGYVIWFLDLGSTFPVEFAGELLQDGAVLSSAPLEIRAPESPSGSEPLPTPMGLSSEGVFVRESNAPTAHPWLKIENFQTDCPPGSILSDSSGECLASWEILNDSNYSIPGYISYELQLEPNLPSTSVSYSATAGICTAGIKNEIVDCSSTTTVGESFKASEYAILQPGQRASYSKTIAWSLTPPPSEGEDLSGDLLVPEQASALPTLHLESIPDAITPGMTVAIHWWIVNFELFPAEAKIELVFAPLEHAHLIDGGEAKIDEATFLGTVPPEIHEGHVIWHFDLDATLPVEFTAQLLQDGEVISSATLLLDYPVLPEGFIAEGSPMSPESSGVTVRQSSPEGPHPWVNFENFQTNCPTSATLPGNSGTCSASWVIYNDSNFTLSDYAGYDLWLDATPVTAPVYFTSITQICRVGSFNAVVDCILEPLYYGHPYGQVFKSQHYVSIPAWQRVSMSKTIHWTLDPAYWWADPRSTVSSCSAKNGGGVTEECPYGQPKSATGYGGDPINTLNGGMDYAIEDLSMPTIAGSLSLHRSYSSQTTGRYTSLLGYGWTHNHDVRLIFNGDPGGQRGVVWFKGHTGNQYAFLVNGDGTYSATSGILATLTKDPGPPITYTLTTEYNTVYQFNEAKLLTSWSDAEGHTWTYAYDGSNRLDTVTDDTSGRYLDFSYDAQNRIETVQDQAARSVTFQYNASGDLWKVTDVTGEVWTYTYDSAHRLTDVVDPRTVTVLHVDYDSQGRAYQQFDGENNLIVHLTYNSDGTTTIEDALGNTETHTYDSRNTVVAETDGYSNPLTKVYDPHFRPSTLTDRNGNPTVLTWSSDGANLEQIVDAGSNTIDLDYDSLNNLTQVVDARDFTTDYVYSGTLLTTVIDPFLKETHYTYTTSADAPQPVGLLKTVEDPNGSVTQYTYDSDGNLIRISDPIPGDTTYTYDSLGRMKSVTNPLGQTDWTCYDDASRVVRTVANASGDGGSPQTDPCDAANYVPSNDPDVDRIVSTVYDVAGNPIATIDPAGIIARTYFDNSNRPVVVVQNLVGQGISNPTPPSYNPASPDQNIRNEMVHDDAGNPIASIDTLGVITRTYYDSANRPQYVVQNLVGQGIEAGTPPSYNASYPDRNLRTETAYDNNGNVIATIDTLGRITRTYYNNLNQVEYVVENLVGQPVSNPTPPSYNPAYPDQNLRTQYVYDASGNTIATVDTLGVITRTYYDALNRPSAVVQNLTGQGIGAGTPPTYNPAYPDQNVRTDYVYDDAGNQIASIDTLGRITRSYFDSGGRLIVEVRNLTGQAIGVGTPPSYNPAYPDQNIRTDYTYDADGRTIAVTDTLGRATRTYYDGLGRSRYIVENLVGQAISVPTPPSYNPVNPDENIRTEYVYDAAGNQVAVIDTLGRITRTYYDDLGRARYVVQNLVGQGISTPTPPAYNPDYPDRNVRTEYSYDGSGGLIEAIDPVGVTTVSCYDGVYRQVRTVINPTIGDPCGGYTPSAEADQDVTTDTVFDGLGNVREVTDPNGNTTEFEYDGVNRLVLERDPLLKETTYTYDGAGNRTAMVDAETAETRYEFDDLGRLTAVVENYLYGGPTNHETNVRTEYTYDGLGNRTKIHDGNGHDTTFGHDDLNRLIWEKDALLHTTTYGYDGLGSRVSLLDANGFTTVFAYDDLNRLTFIDYPAPDADVAFTYDGLGNRKTMVDGVGTTQWSYDELNRVTAVLDPFSDTVGYTYDAAGNRRSITYPGTGAVSYDLDNIGRLETVTDWDLGLTTYTYDKAGRLLQTLLPNGVTSSYLYDDAGNLDYLEHHDGVKVLSSFDYTYDDVGNRLSVSEYLLTPESIVSLPDPIFADGFESGGLTAWSSSATGSGTLTVSTNAALAGTYGMQALVNSTTSRYVRDDLPYLEPRYHARLYFDPNSLTMANNNAFYLLYGYSGSTVVLRAELGFTTAGGYRLQVSAVNNASTWTYSGWVSVTDAPHYLELDFQSGTAGRVDWSLDGIAQPPVTGFDNSSRKIDQVRLGTVAGLDAGTTGTIYFGQTENTIPTTYSLDIVTNLTQVLDDGSNTYLYGLQRIGEEQPGGWLVHLGDVLVSVRQLVDASGVVTLERAYQPFGDELDASGVATTAYGYTGEWGDATGLTFLRARYYTPRLVVSRAVIPCTVMSYYLSR